MFDTKAIIQRCDRDADRADEYGLYTTANTLYLAARELERLLKLNTERKGQ